VSSAREREKEETKEERKLNKRVFSREWTTPRARLTAPRMRIEKRCMMQPTDMEDGENEVIYSTTEVGDLET